MDKAQAWSAYWAQMGADGTCLPGAPRAVSELLDGHWATFARNLPAGSAVLDIATGSGAVPRALVRANPELKATGVDFADVPDSGDAAIELVGNTDATQLSFADNRFDGLTSQFGIEYTDLAASAIEAARVCRAASPFQFIVHHAASPIVAQNRARQAAIADIAKRGIVEMVRAGERRAFENAVSGIAGNHPGQSVVAEISGALAQAMRSDATTAAADVEWVEAGMTREMELLGALRSAAQDEGTIEGFVTALEGPFSVVPAAELRVPGEDRPIAWLVTGRTAD